jgi:hypothetical protein
MSTLGDTLKGIRELLLLQSDVRALEKAVDSQEEVVKHLGRDIIGIDKRLVAVETLIRASMFSRGQGPFLPGGEA